MVVVFIVVVNRSVPAISNSQLDKTNLEIILKEPFFFFLGFIFWFSLCSYDFLLLTTSSSLSLSLVIRFLLGKPLEDRLILEGELQFTLLGC